MLVLEKTLASDNATDVSDEVSSQASLEWEDFGLAEYVYIHQQQHDRVKRRLDGHSPNRVLMGEHPAVITAGRKAPTVNLPDLSVISIERGGEWTYHGPGQLVIYPILKLDNTAPPLKRDLHHYLRTLETWIIKALAEFKIESHQHREFTGVWINSTDGSPLKIASIGVAVKQWVTYHGIGFNVDTELKGFEGFNPCGLNPSTMTSLNEQRIARGLSIVSMDQVKQVIQATCPF